MEPTLTPTDLLSQKESISSEKSGTTSQCNGDRAETTVLLVRDVRPLSTLYRAEAAQPEQSAIPRATLYILNILYTAQSRGAKEVKGSVNLLDNLNIRRRLDDTFVSFQGS